MSRVCLDTSAYSHFKRGDAAAVEALSRATWVGVPVVVVGELRTGFLLGARADRNEAELARFLANPAVEVLEVDDEAAQIYAEIVVAQRRAGRPVPTNDLWIAALAARSGAPVLTYDADFAAIARISTRVLS
jgi:predicted nucleic acid-binding protein